MRRTVALVATAMFVMPSHVFSSFMMHCELQGDVVSSPVRSMDTLEFEFVVRAATDIAIVEGGQGNADCHALEGKRLTVVLATDESGDPVSIRKGARLALERYDIDAVNGSGAIVRSIKYVRK